MKPRKRVEIFKRTDNPDKNLSDFIAYFSPDFDLLGSHFSPSGLTVAKQTIANFIEKTSRLYEQKCRAALAATALEMYVRRWARWATDGRLRVAMRLFRVVRSALSPKNHNLPEGW